MSGQFPAMVEAGREIRKLVELVQQQGDPVTAYLDGIRRLHALDREGLNDSPEAEAIRDELDVVCRLLTPEQRDYVSEQAGRIAAGTPTAP